MKIAAEEERNDVSKKYSFCEPSTIILNSSFLLTEKNAPVGALSAKRPVRTPVWHRTGHCRTGKDCQKKSENSTVCSTPALKQVLMRDKGR
jgi:hypothetical protein